LYFGSRREPGSLRRSSVADAAALRVVEPEIAIVLGALAGLGHADARGLQHLLDGGGIVEAGLDLNLVDLLLLDPADSQDLVEQIDLALAEELIDLVGDGDGVAAHLILVQGEQRSVAEQIFAIDQHVAHIA